MTNNYLFNVASICCILLLFGCNKEARWNTEILNIEEVTHNSAVITVDYDFHKSYNTSGGIYISTSPDFETSKTKKSNYSFTGSDTVRLELDDFFANQQYYVKSFVEKSEETHFSEVFPFKTLDTPPLDCSLTAGELLLIDYGVTENVGLLVLGEDVDDSDLVTYRGNIEGGGNIMFTFLKEPKSGVYSTRENKSDLGGFGAHSFVVFVEFIYHSGSGVCIQRAFPYESMNINVGEDEKVSISFCDLKIKNYSFTTCLSQSFISGKITE